MKLNKSAFLLLLPLLLGGCNVDIVPQEDTPHDEGDTPSEQGGEEGGSEGEGGGSQGGGEVEGGGEDVPPTPPTPQLDTLTVSQVIELCNDLEPATDNIKITTSDIKVKFTGQAIDGIDTKNSKKGHTPQMKVVVADSTGYILVASESGSQSENTLYRSFVNNKQKRNSKYTIEGKIGLYRGQPEVVVESFTWDENLPVTYDVADMSEGKIDDVPAFYEQVINEVDYNSKGQGIGKIHSLNNVKCIGKADDNSWIFTDETSSVFGVYDFISNTSFSKGSVYNITGMLTTNVWKPSLRVLEYELIEDVEIQDPYFVSPVETTTKATYNIKRPKFDDDDYRRYPDYLRSFKNIYKTEAYVSYDSPGKLIFGDTYYNTVPSSTGVAAQRGYIYFNNDDIELSYLADYIGQNETVTIYYSFYQQDQVTYSKVTYMQWKVYMYPDALAI